eukprot:g8572.t1
MLEAAWRIVLLQKKAEVYEQLRGVLEAHAAVLFDEGDTILHSRKQLSYPLVEHESISPHGAEIAVFILHEMLIEKSEEEDQGEQSVGGSFPQWPRFLGGDEESGSNRSQNEDDERAREGKRLLLDEIIANAQTKIQKNYLSKQILLPLADVLCEEIRRSFRESPGAQRSDMLNEFTESYFLTGCVKYLRHAAIEGEMVEAGPSAPRTNDDAPEQAGGRATSRRAKYEIMKDSAQGFYDALSTVNTHDPRWRRLQDQLSVAKAYLHPIILDSFEKEVGKDFGWSIEDPKLEAAVPYRAGGYPAETPGEISAERLLALLITELFELTEEVEVEEVTEAEVEEVVPVTITTKRSTWQYSEGPPERGVTHDHTESIPSNLVVSGPMELVAAGSEAFVWSATGKDRMTWQTRLQPPLTKTDDLAFVHELDAESAKTTLQLLLEDPTTSRRLQTSAANSVVRVSALVDVAALFKGQNKRLVACGMLSYVPPDDGSFLFLTVSERTEKDQIAQGISRIGVFPFARQHIAFVIDSTRTKARMLKFRRDWLHPVQDHDCVRFSLSFGQRSSVRETLLGLVMPTDERNPPRTSTSRQTGDLTAQLGAVEPNEDIPTHKVCVLTSEVNRLRRKYKNDSGVLAQLDDDKLFTSGGRRSAKATETVSCAEDLYYNVHASKPPGDASRLRGRHWFEPGGNLSMAERVSNEESLWDRRADAFYGVAKILARAEDNNSWLSKHDVIAYAWWTQERTEKKTYADALVMQVRAIVKRPLQFWRSFLNGYKGWYGTGTGGAFWWSALQTYAPRTRFQENDCAEADVEGLPEIDATNSNSREEGRSSSLSLNKRKVLIRGYDEFSGVYDVVEDESQCQVRIASQPEIDENGHKCNPADAAPSAVRIWQVQPENLVLQKRYRRWADGTLLLRCTPHAGFEEEHARSRFAKGDLVVVTGVFPESSRDGGTISPPDYDGSVARVVEYDVKRHFYTVDLPPGVAAVDANNKNYGLFRKPLVGYSNMRLYNPGTESTSSSSATEHDTMPGGSAKGASVPARAQSKRVAEDVLLRNRDLDSLAQTFYAAARDLLLTIEDGSLWRQMGNLQQLSNPERSFADCQSGWRALSP